MSTMVAQRLFGSLSREGLGVVVLLRARAAAVVVLVGLLLAVVWCVPAGAVSVCGNAVVRGEDSSSGLPDCRAYEMVTPAYKEGYGLFTLGYSSNGDKAILYSFANLAGDPGQGKAGLEDGVYLVSRGALGWQISGMNAPLSEFVGQDPLAVEADSGVSLWDQHTPQQSTITRGLYIRSASGAYSFVGPLNPIAGPEEESDTMEVSANDYTAPVAATRDYGHIALEASSAANYWSFDATKSNAGSLYEYSGTANEHPILVSVSGVKGSTSLLGECGSVLGSGTLAGSLFNALSGDGETVFFTVEAGCGAPAPATAEVYARVHGSLVSPLAAENFDVSANECTVACGGGSGKNFEGASENGKRVFFTSTQKLTNDAVDGTAGGDASENEGCAKIGGSGCNLYEYDFAAAEGERLRLVAGGAGVLGVLGIAEDGSRVYFTAREALAAAGENEYGKSPVEGEANLYVYNSVSGKTAFIATLSASDESDWVRRLEARPVELAGGEGRFLVFPSSQSGLADEVTTTNQLYEYDAQTGELVRVSKGEDGYNNDGKEVNSGLEVINIEKAFRTSANTNSVAEDGETVIFASSGQLSVGASSALVGCASVYEFRSEGPISQGGVHLISDGRDVQPNKGTQCGAQFQAMDSEAGNILFATDDPLVVGDVDGVQRDLYDAREEGGFPGGPVLGEPGLCAGEGCEAPVVSPALTGALGSKGVSPEGSVSTGPASKPAAKKKASKKRKPAKKKKKSKKKKKGSGKRAGVLGKRLGRGGK